MAPVQDVAKVLMLVIQLLERLDFQRKLIYSMENDAGYCFEGCCQGLVPHKDFIDGRIV